MSSGFKRLRQSRLELVHASTHVNHVVESGAEIEILFALSWWPEKFQIKILEYLFICLAQMHGYHKVF